MYVNKAIILGNITRDPEIKLLPSGTGVCAFSVATNRNYTDKNGAKVSEVEFHNAVAYGKTAEVIAQYMRKGSQIFIEGRIKTHSWEGKDGVKRYRTEIIVEAMQFGNKPKTETQNTQEEAEVAEDYSDIGETVKPEDIPF